MPGFDLLEEEQTTPPLPEVEDELSSEFVNDLIDKIVLFIEALSGNTFHNYQKGFARRIVESVVIRDAEVITALASRQSGKSETVANTVSGLMVILPRLAKMFPTLLGAYKDGFWVGLFAPVEGQAETLYSRVVSRLTSDRALEILSDPEIDDKAKRISGVTRGLRLERSGSFCMMMTARGRMKRVSMEEFASVRPSGLIAMNLDEGDTLGWARLTSGKDEVIIVTENGQALRFSEDKVRAMGRQAARWPSTASPQSWSTTHRNSLCGPTPSPPGSARKVWR